MFGIFSLVEQSNSIASSQIVLADKNDRVRGEGSESIATACGKWASSKLSPGPDIYTYT